MNRDELMFKYMNSLEIKRKCIRCHASHRDVVMEKGIPFCDFCIYFCWKDVKEIIDAMEIYKFKYSIKVFSELDSESDLIIRGHHHKWK